MDLLNSQNDTDEKINPTVLAKDCNILNIRPGEGDGRLINWEIFWELVEKTYWKNRIKISLECKNAN